MKRKGCQICGHAKGVHSKGGCQEIIGQLGPWQTPCGCQDYKPVTFGFTLRQPEGLNPPPLELRSPTGNQGQLL